MNQVITKLVFGCLNCDKPIPLSANKQICSVKCLREINQVVGDEPSFDKNDVWMKGRKE